MTTGKFVDIYCPGINFPLLTGELSPGWRDNRYRLDLSKTDIGVLRSTFQGQDFPITVKILSDLVAEFETQE